MASAKPEWITDAQNDPRFRRRAGKALKDNERALEDHVKTLSETQEALEEKGRQLAASRDHLELQVTMRTSELAEALKQEQEFNALQREFIGMASHEFRTPVTIIDGETRRIIKRAETMEPQQIVERGKRIRDQVKRINELIDSTLSLTRLDDGLVELKLENCDLQKLLAHICGVQVGHAPGKKIMFMGVDLPETIVADPPLLGQVFSNLLSNAVKTAS
jgi:signal transduction histidine kinase